MDDRGYVHWKNNWMQKLDRDSRRHINCVRVGSNETSEHAMAKFHMIDKMRKAAWPGSVEFITECFSADRKFRADIIFFVRGVSKPEVVEIPVNETEESMDKKMKFWLSEGFNFTRANLYD
jgi:hypothetical protein